jgi:hypothetical protein
MCIYYNVSGKFKKGSIVSSHTKLLLSTKGELIFKTSSHDLSVRTISWIKEQLIGQTRNTCWAYWLGKCNRRYLVQISHGCYEGRYQFTVPKGAIANGVLVFPEDVESLDVDVLGVFGDHLPLASYESKVADKLVEILNTSKELAKLGARPITGKRTAEPHLFPPPLADPSDFPYWLSHKMPRDMSQHDALSIRASLARLDACNNRLTCLLEGLRQ